jgi:hypothetical protein
MIVVIAFTFVIILVNITAIIELVMIRVTITITIRMEDFTKELPVIINCYYLLNFRGLWGRILSSL